MSAIILASHISAVAGVLPLTAGTGSLHLASDWSSLWGSISGSIGPLTRLLGAIGLILMLIALIRWVIDKRRGGQANHAGLLWTAIFGAILSAPNMLLPTALTLVDKVVNAGGGWIQTFVS
jgi:hypothetical protein